jgi:hypothetical protein
MSWPRLAIFRVHPQMLRQHNVVRACKAAPAKVSEDVITCIQEDPYLE